MGEFLVEVRFMLRGVWVKPEALGQSYKWVENGLRTSLTLPRSPEDLYYERENETIRYPAISHPALVEGSGPAVSVDVVKVEVGVQADTTMEDKRAAKEAYEKAGDADMKAR